MAAMDTILDMMRADDGGRELLNVKFFRGSKDIITVDEFRREIRSALMQKKMRTASLSVEAPKSNHPQLKLKEFVETL